MCWFNIFLPCFQLIDVQAELQCSPFIMLCMGSMGMDCVIRESCYKGTISQRNYLWSFYYNSFVKFHGKNIWEPQNDSVTEIHDILRCVIINRLHCIDIAKILLLQKC